MTFFNVREMRDVNGVRNPFENPTVPLSSVGLGDSTFGQSSSTDSGETVTVDKAMTIPTVFRCIGLLSTVIAGCPVRAYTNPGKVEAFPRILNTSNVSMTYTQFELWELVVAHLALWGNAYVLKVRDPMGRIIDLRPICPSMVEVKLSPSGNKIFEAKRLKSDGTPDQDNNRPIVYTTYEVMHIPGLGYDGLKGMSPITQAARTLGSSIAADRLAGRYFAKGTFLSGVINVKAPLTSQTQADAIRARWIAKNGGIGPSSEVAVLDSETTFQPLTIAPEALQFLESRRWQTTEIARMFGIPPHLVGDVEKSTSWGTGIEQQNVGFVSYTVSGWTNRIEQRLSREIIYATDSTTYAEFDLDRLMRGSMSERFEAYALAIQWGWMTRNEARIKENMSELPGLSEPLTPLNMMTGNPNDILGPASSDGGKNPTVTAGSTKKALPAPTPAKGQPASKGTVK